MYAVIQTGGKQYKIKTGDKIKVEKIDASVGSKISFPNIVMIADGKDIKLDEKTLEKGKVEGEILSHGKNKKVISLKRKKRKGFHKKIGHRQEYTEVKIENINLS